MSTPRRRPAPGCETTVRVRGVGLYFSPHELEHVCRRSRWVARRGRGGAVWSEAMSVPEACETTLLSELGFAPAGGPARLPTRYGEFTARAHVDPRTRLHHL